MAKPEGERGLLPPARLLLRDRLGYSLASMLEEVPTPWGRPDLVAVTTLEQGSDLRPISRREIVLLAMLGRTGPLGEAEIASRLGLSAPSVRSRLSGLLSRGLVEDVGGAIGVTGRWGRLDSICAIELKLRDWRRGLLQALRYRTFADLVYVFLGRIPSTLDPEHFSRNGIGLADLGPDPDILLMAEPVSGFNLVLGRMMAEENIRIAAARQRTCEDTPGSDWLSSSGRARNRKPRPRRTHRTRSREVHWR